MGRSLLGRLGRLGVNRPGRDTLGKSIDEDGDAGDDDVDDWLLL